MPLGDVFFSYFMKYCVFAVMASTFWSEKTALFNEYKTYIIEYNIVFFFQTKYNSKGQYLLKYTA